MPFGTRLKAGSQQLGMQTHEMSSVISSSKRLVQQEQPYLGGSPGILTPILAGSLRVSGASASAVRDAPLG